MKRLPSTADVIIIGSCAGGGTLAHQLASARIKVVLVERGGHLSNAKCEHEPIGHCAYDVHCNRSIPMSYVGGQTKFYGAALCRFRESDFVETRHESGVSPAWSINYAELEHFYGEAERLYRVHGDVAADGPNLGGRARCRFLLSTIAR